MFNVKNSTRYYGDMNCIKKTLDTQDPNIKKNIISYKNIDLRIIDEDSIINELKNKKIIIISTDPNYGEKAHHLKKMKYDLDMCFKDCKLYLICDNNDSIGKDIFYIWKSIDKNVYGHVIDKEKKNINFDNIKNTIKNWNEYDYIIIVNDVLEFSRKNFLTCFILSQDFDIIFSNATYRNTEYNYYSPFINIDNEKESQYKNIYSFTTWTKIKTAYSPMLLCKNNILNYNGSIKYNDFKDICNKYNNLFINPKWIFQLECQDNMKYLFNIKSLS